MWTNVRVVIWCENECPVWSFDVSTNVRVVIWCEHKCPALSKIAWERMSVHRKDPAMKDFNLGTHKNDPGQILTLWEKLRKNLNTDQWLWYSDHA